jgi:hypothetical protein
MIGPITFTQILAWEISEGRFPGGVYGLAAALLALSLLAAVAVGRASALSRKPA